MTPANRASGAPGRTTGKARRHPTVDSDVMGDSRPAFTFGILLSGLLAAEAEVQAAPAPRRRRPLRARSGTYPNPSRTPVSEAPGPRPGPDAPSATR